MSYFKLKITIDLLWNMQTVLDVCLVFNVINSRLIYLRFVDT